MSSAMTIVVGDQVTIGTIGPKWTVIDIHQWQNDKGVMVTIADLRRGAQKATQPVTSLIKKL